MGEEGDYSGWARSVSSDPVAGGPGTTPSPPSERPLILFEEDHLPGVNVLTGANAVEVHTG